eukprot:Colp12_sorted_trinity150504_noHs@21576
MSGLKQYLVRRGDQTEKFEIEDETKGSEFESVVKDVFELGVGSLLWYRGEFAVPLNSVLKRPGEYKIVFKPDHLKAYGSSWQTPKSYFDHQREVERKVAESTLASTRARSAQLVNEGNQRLCSVTRDQDNIYEPKPRSLPILADATSQASIDTAGSSSSLPVLVTAPTTQRGVFANTAAAPNVPKRVENDYFEQVVKIFNFNVPNARYAVWKLMYNNVWTLSGDVVRISASEIMATPRGKQHDVNSFVYSLSEDAKEYQFDLKLSSLIPSTKTDRSKPRLARYTHQVQKEMKKVNRDYISNSTQMAGYFLKYGRELPGSETASVIFSVKSLPCVLPLVRRSMF